MKQLFRSRQSFKSFFAFISLALLLCGSLTILAARATVASAATTPVPQAIGQVVWVKGSVQAMQPGHSQRALKRRDVIFAEDTIVTDATGTGEIIFTDSSVVALHSDTQLKVDQYKYDPNAPKDDKYVASLAKGGFRTITGLISKGHPENYQVNTPVATIGVRGTIYDVFTDGSSVQLGILKGAITATNTSGTYEVNKAKTLPYAEITGIGKPAVLTNTQPAGLTTMPALTSTSTPSATVLQQQANSQQNAAGKTTSTFGGTSGGNGTTSGGSSSGGTTSSGGSSSTDTSSGGTTNTSSGGDTTVGGTDTGSTGSTNTSTTGSTDTGSTTTTTATPTAAPTSTGGVCIGK